MKELTALQTASATLANAVSGYCKARMAAGKCDEYDCDLCPVLGAYNMAKQDGDPNWDNAVSDLLKESRKKDNTLTEDDIQKKVVDLYGSPDEEALNRLIDEVMGLGVRIK